MSSLDEVSQRLHEIETRKLEYEIERLHYENRPINRLLSFSTKIFGVITPLLAPLIAFGGLYLSIVQYTDEQKASRDEKRESVINENAQKLLAFHKDPSISVAELFRSYSQLNRLLETEERKDETQGTIYLYVEKDLDFSNPRHCFFEEYTRRFWPRYKGLKDSHRHYITVTIDNGLDYFIRMNLSSINDVRMSEDKLSLDTPDSWNQTQETHFKCLMESYSFHLSKMDQKSQYFEASFKNFEDSLSGSNIKETITIKKNDKIVFCLTQERACSKGI